MPESRQWWCRLSRPRETGSCILIGHSRWTLYRRKGPPMMRSGGIDSSRVR